MCLSQIQILKLHRETSYNTNKLRVLTLTSDMNTIYALTKLKAKNIWNWISGAHVNQIFCKQLLNVLNEGTWYICIVIVAKDPVVLLLRFIDRPWCKLARLALIVYLRSFPDSLVSSSGQEHGITSRGWGTREIRMAGAPLPPPAGRVWEAGEACGTEGMRGDSAPCVC